MYSLLAGRGTERKHWVAQRGKHIRKFVADPSATVLEKHAGTAVSTLPDGRRGLVRTRRRSSRIAAV